VWGRAFEMDGETISHVAKEDEDMVVALDTM